MLRLAKRFMGDFPTGYAWHAKAHSRSTMGAVTFPVDHQSLQVNLAVFMAQKNSPATTRGAENPSAMTLPVGSGWIAR